MGLVRRAQAGEREAFEMLVDRHANEIYRWRRRSSASSTHAMSDRADDYELARAVLDRIMPSLEFEE